MSHNSPTAELSPNFVEILQRSSPEELLRHKEDWLRYLRAYPNTVIYSIIHTHIDAINGTFSTKEGSNQ
ncbi:hypothetical protein KBD33_06750 [Candidatus Gracilibacteria bacterium]|nr:hypothetical protein [Candidatus Gracilibacteria bacterium]